jgi:hypothetical protein
MKKIIEQTIQEKLAINNRIYNTNLTKLSVYAQDLALLPNKEKIDFALYCLKKINKNVVRYTDAIYICRYYVCQIFKIITNIDGVLIW